MDIWAADSSAGMLNVLTGIERWVEWARHDVMMDCSRSATSAVFVCISRAL